ncbi:MAG: valine--tRNA ligase [Defluviitaleaceae bacterium]|nr:valine--tRNA ligase [Defluviitaleaceae bacterium]
MEKNFDPKTGEERIYNKWLKAKYFHAQAKEGKESYTISLPPPNITGALHMGHALNATLQDILIRFKRMQGYNTLWVPGTDHASISTEMKIVESLAEKGFTKEDIGREKFLEMAWQWKEKYGGIIVEQLKKIGISCDWDRERFTLDQGLSQAVLHVFIDLHKKGYIYKGERLINWCPHCKTTISDAEVEHKDNKGKLWHMKYKVEGTNDYLTFATTRPETILGDVALAVNPNDSRYNKYVGKTAVVPIVNRQIPIIADAYVDMEFGTGVVKITPGHDFNDYEIALRHKLPSVNIFNNDATINDVCEEYIGMDRYVARKEILKKFTDMGQFVKGEYIENTVGCHDKCGVVMEPLNKLQWFVKMEEMAKPALQALETNQFRFVPSRFGKIYTNWLEDIKDWCISRQLWWGHRIPAYYCSCNHTTVAINATKCESCGNADIKQDEDVLDTWFSSALWPFSTLGWPNDSQDMKDFFPTNVLVTGPDIIFFWVVRMVFSSMEQTGQVPFKDVIINGIVRDAENRKMSKTLGNGIDPLDIIEQYGADSLRLALVIGNALGADQRFSNEKVEANRNFLNKIWNASRFLQMNEKELGVVANISDDHEFSLADKWILNKLNSLIGEITTNMEHYELGVALQKIYDFAWSEYCDWYIEMAKANLKDPTKKDATLYTLRYVLITVLRLLHPYVPFITEEIFTNLQNEEESLVVSDWPKPASLDYGDEEKAIETTKQAIKEIRNIRRDMNIPVSQKIKITIVSDQMVVENFFAALAGASQVKLQPTKDQVEQSAVVIQIPTGTIYLEDLLDTEKEIKRLTKEKEKLEKELARAESMLSNADFLAKAPAKMVQSEEAKKEEYNQLLKKVTHSLEALKK